MHLAQPLASNDPAFRAVRGRTVPIPDSLTSIPGYPEKLRIYRIKASRFWQVRCWFRGKTYTRSLRTTSKRNAMNLARCFFDELAGRLFRPDDDDHDVQTPRLFGQLAEAMYLHETERHTRGEFSRGSLQVMRNRLDLHILPELGTRPIQAIGHMQLQALVARLGRAGFSSTTISQYLVIVRKVFKLARQLGQLRDMPEFPVVKVHSTPRGGFSVGEYARLLRAARRLRGQIHPVAKTLGESARFWIHRDLLVMPPDVAWAIAFMVNTFIRPSDLKIMRHRYVEEVRGSHVYLRMNLPETKRHDKPVVSMRAAVRIYGSLKSAGVKMGAGGPDDYLFLPQIANREHALAVLNFHFQWVLKECGLTYGPLGQRRTLYSLRHTAISFRLLYGQGIDMLTLARNARTSVQMIERFYAASLSGEMNVGLLHSRRGTK